MSISPDTDEYPPGSASLRKGRDFRRHVMKGSLWAAAGKISLTFGGLVLNVILARALPPARVGEYFLLLTMVTIAATIGGLGQGEAIVRVAADALANKGSASARAAMIRSFQIALVASGAVALLMMSPAGRALGDDFLGISDFADLAILAGIWSWLQVLQILISESFRSLQQINRATLFGGAVKNLAVAAVLAGLVLRPGDLTLTEVIVATIVVLALSNLIGLRLLVKDTSSFDRGGTADSRRLIDVGAPLMLNTLALFLIVRLNLWILGAQGSTVDVALYGAAVQLVTLVTTPLLLLNAVLPPIIAERYPRAEQHDSLQRTLRSLTAMVGIPSIVLLGIFVVLGEEILGLVFGSAYREAAWALVLLAIGQSANVWSGPCGALLKMADQQRLLLAINAGTGVAAVVASLIVVPHFGVTGAAAVSGAALVFQNALQVWAARRRTGILTLIETSPSTLVSEARATIKTFSRRSQT